MSLGSGLALGDTADLAAAGVAPYVQGDGDGERPKFIRRRQRGEVFVGDVAVGDLPGRRAFPVIERVDVAVVVLEGVVARAFEVIGATTTAEAADDVGGDEI